MFLVIPITIKIQNNFINLKVPLFGNCLLSHPQPLATNDLISVLTVLLSSEYPELYQEF